MKLIRILHFTAAATFFFAAAVAQTPQSFDKVRAMASADAPVAVENDLIIEGIVIGDCDSKNMELNVNVSQSQVDLTPNDKTSYIQSADGRYGFRLRFASVEDNELHRYGKVKINLRGTKIVRENDPERYTIDGLTAENIVDAVKGDASAVVPKQKFIGELTDEDVYTFVTLKEVEFVIKDGSYTNIWEPYCIKSELHPDNEKDPKYYKVTSRMDGWASLVRDSRNNAIYMPVNTLCQWRRTGKRIPQGQVALSGIVVHTEMRRYGGNMGRYSIRPVDGSDIVADKKAKSPYKVLIGWFLENNTDASLDFEYMGTKTGIENKKEVRGDRILPDVGRGFMWTTSNSYIMVTNDFNALDTYQRGAVYKGALFFNAPTPDWYTFDAAGKANGVNSFLIEFSTAKIKGTDMALCFDFGAGNQDANGSWNYPAEWKVECSYDGIHWTLLKDSATGSDKTVLRPVPFWPKVVEGSGNPKPLPTGYDCGMGLQQHMYALPQSMFGREKVLIAISPASTKLSQIRANPEKDVIMDNKVVNKNIKQQTIIRFGSIYVCYK